MSFPRVWFFSPHRIHKCPIARDVPYHQPRPGPIAALGIAPEGEVAEWMRLAERYRLAVGLRAIAPDYLRHFQRESV